MGADTFVTAAAGSTVEEAFSAAQAQARYDFGHSGYTGSIAEKGDWVIISYIPVSFDEAVDTANRLIQEDDARIRDKWGPAGALPTTDGTWVFFGWASC